MTKQRLDVELTARGLAESRQKAQAMIMAGQVYVDGRKVDMAGTLVGPGCAIEVRGRTLAYVSRGGLKLEKAVERWPIRLEGAVCADIGSSTGGFTDCMLQRGAEKVYAVDSGNGGQKRGGSGPGGPSGGAGALPGPCPGGGIFCKGYHLFPHHRPGGQY